MLLLRSLRVQCISVIKGGSFRFVFVFNHIPLAMDSTPTEEGDMVQCTHITRDGLFRFICSIERIPVDMDSTPMGGKDSV